MAHKSPPYRSEAMPHGKQVALQAVEMRLKLSGSQGHGRGQPANEPKSGNHPPFLPTEGFASPGELRNLVTEQAGPCPLKG